MKIEGIHIEGFGALRGIQFTLVPQVNLFVGDNESGKSTLQQAILALLYGFYQGSRISPSERREHETFRPWLGSTYEGSLDYVLNSGHRFRIQRSFDTDDVPTAVIDLTTGRDVTGQLGLGRHGNVPVATAHLGMRRDVFVSTCFVNQAAILKIDAPDAVAETVVSIADTATVDSSAVQAIARIEETLSRQVGGPRARVRALPLARDRLQRARSELLSLEQAEMSIRSNLARKDGLEKQHRELYEERRRTAYLLLSKRLDELQGISDRLLSIDEGLATLGKEAETLKEYSAFPVELRDTVMAEKERLATVSQQRDDLQTKWAGASPELDTVQKDMRTCCEDVARMEVARDFPLEKEEAFNGLRLSRQHSLEQLTSLRLQIADLQHNLSQARAAKRLPKSALVGGLGLALAIGILSTLSGVSPIGLPLAVVIALVVSVSYFLLRPTPTGRIKIDELTVIAQDEEAHAADAERQLMNLLEEVGAKAETLDSAVEVFQSRATTKKSLQLKEETLGRLDERLKRLLSVRQQLEDSANQVGEVTAALLRTLQRANINADDVNEGIARFEEHHNKRLRLDRTLDRIENLKEQRKALLGNETQATLAHRREHVNAQKAAILAAAPELSGAATDRSLQELEGEDAQLGTQLGQTEQEIASLGATVETTLISHRQRYEIEEDVTRYESETSRLEQFASALNLARDTLQKAMEEVHREFAPRLAEALARNLSVVTRGRYDTAYVDPEDLSIRLRAPETGAIVDAQQLSRGTQEQAYLLLRVELARMLSARRESLPLILDDPFVNFDDGRVRSTLELLMEISKENQVLLFTKDARIAQWFHSHCEEGTVFKLHELPLLPEPRSEP